MLTIKDKVSKEKFCGFSNLQTILIFAVVNFLMIIVLTMQISALHSEMWLYSYSCVGT